MPTQQQIAEHLDMNQSEVSKHMATLNIDWKEVSLDDIRVAYIRHMRGMAAGHKTSDGEDLVRERVLTERVDREIKQFTLAEKKGMLINVAQIEPELTQMVSAFRTELLSRDDKLKADLDALYDIDIDLELLNEHTRSALGQLARYDSECARTGAPFGRESGSAGKDDDDGMGATSSPDVSEGIG